MEIQVSRKLLAFLTIFALIVLVLSTLLQLPIFGLIALFVLINNVLNFFRKIKITERQAIYYAFCVQRNIRYIESIHCAGFLIFNCVYINGSGISAIKLYGVANFAEIKKFSENV